MASDKAALISVAEQLMGCPADVAAIIADRARIMRHPSRYRIDSPSTSSGLVFLMVDGEARALAYAADGRFVLVEEFRPGDLFGEIFTLSAPVPTLDVAEIIAHEAVTTGQFATSSFLALMEQYNCVALAVAQVLIRRLALANRKVVQIATISAPGRTYAELLRKARESGDWRITPPPVLAELALAVQSTRETVSRAVSVLEKRGIITRDATALTVVAPHRLEELIY